MKRRPFGASASSLRSIPAMTLHAIVLVLSSAALAGCTLAVDEPEEEGAFHAARRPLAPDGATSSQVSERRPAHCWDDAIEAGESDVDCGGSCPPCGLSARCDADDDCATGLCLVGHCAECITADHCAIGECCSAGICALPNEATNACDPKTE